MGKTIFNLFKNYYNQLMKLEEVKADRNDLIAIEEQAVRSMFTQKVFKSISLLLFFTLSFSSTKVNLSKRSDAFTLGERDKILDQVCLFLTIFLSIFFFFQIESEPILVHVATAESLKFSYEVLLRSVVKHLSDAATSEFLFIIDFFKTNSQDTFNK